eukprot:6489725-Amphidinium_carterae.2
MDRPTRAAKLAEIWKQLTWLENEIDATPYMVAATARSNSCIICPQHNGIEKQKPSRKPLHV